jgi:hypothetical protein
MAYREAAPEVPDREALADAALAVRVARVRVAVTLACMLTTFAVGAALTGAVILLQFALLAKAWVKLSALVGFGVSMPLGFRLTFALGRSVVRRRLPRWVDELASRHQLPPGPMRERAAIWE